MPSGSGLCIQVDIFDINNKYASGALRPLGYLAYDKHMRDNDQ